MFHTDVKRRDCPDRCPSVANAISRGSGIFRGRSILFNDLLNLILFSKYIRTLNIFYAMVRIMFHVNRGLKLG